MFPRSQSNHYKLEQRYSKELRKKFSCGSGGAKPTPKQSWRDGKHAKDAINIGKVVKKGSSYSIEIGWDKADNSPHYYMKFQNWGTSKNPNPPHKGFAEKTLIQSEKEALKEMEREFMRRITGR